MKSFSQYILEGAGCSKCGCQKGKRKEKCECSCHIESESFTIDPKAHRQQQRAAKIRTLAQKGATEGEKAAAEKKTKGPKMFGEGAAWTKKEGQNKEGGLNEKGRKSYERENPGSDLKAPSKKVGNPRRKSFCARMKGMRKRQKPENNTGDDRLSKSLRAWNC